jgi:hypothetical protein
MTGLRLLKAEKQLDADLDAPCGLERDEMVHIVGRLDGGFLDFDNKSYESVRCAHLKRAHEHLSLAVDE